MKNLPLFALLALLLISAACAGASVQHVPLPDQGVPLTRPEVTRIYVVRDQSTSIQKREVVVFDDATEIGALSTSTFLCWERAGGRTLGRAFYKALEPRRGRLEGIVDLDCKAGSVYYFNITVGREIGQPAFELLTPEQGRKLVEERRPAAKP